MNHQKIIQKQALEIINRAKVTQKAHQDILDCCSDILQKMKDLADIAKRSDDMYDLIDEAGEQIIGAMDKLTIQSRKRALIQLDSAKEAHKLFEDE